MRIIYISNKFHYLAYLTVKKIAAILMLAILAFNWIGYRFVSQWLENKADHSFQSKIENAEYDETSLIRITVPLNAPYMSGSSKDFERYDGKIDIDGVHYRYVKRKIADGNLVLLCLPNESRKKIENSRMDFFKLVNDLNNHSSQSKEKSSSSFKSFTTEYSQENNSWNIIAINSVQPVHTAADFISPTSDYSSVVKQPPRA